jgi:hypothetical protein
MTRGRRRALLGGALAIAASRRAMAADGPGVEALMQGFARVRVSRAAFTEAKAIPELDLPLPSEGTLAWQAPDRLEKHTVSPIEEVLRVAGNRLTYDRPDRGIHQEFGLDDQPEMRALVEAIRSTLAGDLATLRRHYAVAFDGAPAGAWRMILTPTSLRVRSAVQRIVLAGQGAVIGAVDTEGNGGVTRMRITPLP